jgi:PTS system mannose-specific IID component
VGDSLFGGSIYVFWSLSTMVFLALNLPWLALVWAAGWILVFEGFKVYTFWMGISQGIPFLVRLKSWNLINWSGRIKVINAVLLFVFWIIVWPGPKTPLTWMAGTGGVFVLAWLASLFYRAREVILILLAVALMAAPSMLPWVRGLM